MSHPASFNSYSYDVIDTKLAKAPRAKFFIQLALYYRLLADVRAKSLVCVVAHPVLMAISCSMVEEMTLVNTLC